jgi:hypothetical protein
VFLAGHQVFDGFYLGFANTRDLKARASPLSIDIESNRKVMLPADLAVDAEVDLGTTGGAYFLQARLNVSLPGLEREVAQALVDGAHQTCPYTKATRGNISVVTNLVETGSVTVTEYLLTPWDVAG